MLSINDIRLRSNQKLYSYYHIVDNLSKNNVFVIMAKNIEETKECLAYSVYIAENDEHLEFVSMGDKLTALKVQDAVAKTFEFTGLYKEKELVFVCQYK